MDIIKEVRKRIEQEADEKYQKFSSALLPGINNLAGVRLPALRKIAREIYKSDWKTYLKNTDCRFMEETMLKGMVIGLIQDEPSNILEQVRTFIPQINNWSVCDSFCCGLKFVNKNKELVWDFLQKYLNSQKEFEIRFAVVVILNYYIEKDYIDKVLDILGNIRTNDYYAQMAVAWAVSICYVKFETKTYKFLKNSKLDKIIFNKSIQKIIESNRISKETKAKLKLMKND